jgi:hypothetical protein
VFSSFDARALNVRTEVAHVAVSTLGKMLRTLRLPAKDPSVISARFLWEPASPAAEILRQHRLDFRASSQWTWSITSQQSHRPERVAPLP